MLAKSQTCFNKDTYLQRAILLGFQIFIIGSRQAPVEADWGQTTVRCFITSMALCYGGAATSSFHSSDMKYGPYGGAATFSFHSTDMKYALSICGPRVFRPGTTIFDKLRDLNGHSVVINYWGIYTVKVITCWSGRWTILKKQNYIFLASFG